jgi:hypothetical protein
MSRKQKIEIENFTGVGVFGDKNKVKSNAAKPDKPKPADDTSEEPPHEAAAGPSKVEFCRRLGDSWRDLADVVELPRYRRAAFDRGDEARGIWDWLEARDRLPELPVALRTIDRADLADLLDGGRS